MKVYYLLCDDCSNRTNLDPGNIYYFDNNSTTLIRDPGVRDEIIEWISCGNPSNTLHDFGMIAHNKVEESHNRVGMELGIEPSEVYFTSGATESNNIIIQGVIKHHIENLDADKKFSIITSSFEHPSVLNIFRHYEGHNHIEVIYVNPCMDSQDPGFGRIRPEDIAAAIEKANYKVILVSVMYANNETGAIQDIKSISRITSEKQIFFHSDITQGLGKYIIRPRELGLDAASFSGHKFHGPKGIGGMYISKKHNNLMNLCYGGEQENHRRPGTENVAYIVGLTEALQLVHRNREEKNARMLELSRRILDGVRKHEDVTLLGPPDEHRLPNTLLLKINNLGTCNRHLVRELNRRKIYVSVGSACQTEHKASHVLDTIGITDKKDKIKVIRISLSDYTTQEEVDYLVQNLTEAVKLTREKLK